MGLVRQINIGSDDVGYLLRETPDITSIVSENNISYKWIRYNPTTYYIYNAFGTEGKMGAIANRGFDTIKIKFNNGSELNRMITTEYYQLSNYLPIFNFSEGPKQGYYYYINRVKYLKAWLYDSEDGYYINTIFPAEPSDLKYGFLNDPDYPTYNPKYEFNYVFSCYVTYDGEY